MKVPMQLGPFSPEIAAETAAELFEKAKNDGFTQMQFDFASLVDKEMPEQILDDLLAEIGREAIKNGVEIRVINGTYNMSHPDAKVREEGAKRFREIARAAKVLGCEFVSLCAGTRTRESMWVPHPDNNTPEAWADLSHSVEKVLAIADEFDIVLLLETEDSNVINSPEKTLRLIRQMRSQRLKVIMDCANLFNRGTAYRHNVRDIINKGFDLLGEHVVCAHGKDIKEGDGLEFVGAGQGIVDFAYFLEKLDEIGYDDGMILHGIKRESDIPHCIEYIRDVENRI
jgi:sugar phosphate isomerase/epimerase